MLGTGSTRSDPWASVGKGGGRYVQELLQTYRHLEQKTNTGQSTRNPEGPGELDPRNQQRKQNSEPMGPGGV